MLPIFRTAAVMAVLMTISSSGKAASTDDGSTDASTRFEAGAGLAAAWTQIREDIVVPIRFAGPGGALDLAYRIKLREWDTDVRLRLGGSVVFDRYGTTNEVLVINLAARVHRDALRSSIGLFRLGGFLSERRLFEHLGAWDDSHIYWLNYIGLGPSGELVTPVTASRSFVTSLAVPIVALVTRPPRYLTTKADDIASPWYWASRIGDHPTLSPLGRLVSAGVRIDYRGTSRGWRVDPWTGVDFDWYSEPVAITHLTFWLGAEVRLAWGDHS